MKRKKIKNLLAVLEPKPQTKRVVKTAKKVPQSRFSWDVALSRITKVEDNARKSISETSKKADETTKKRFAYLLEKAREDKRVSDFKHRRTEGSIAELKDLIKDETSKLRDEMIGYLAPITKAVASIPEPKDNSTEIQELRNEFNNRMERLSYNKGGSINRQIKVGGTDPLTKYTDINLVAGSGVSITTADDNTEKNVDMTFSVSGIGTSIVTPPEVPDGIITAFTFVSKPKLVFVDGGRAVQEVSGDSTVNWTYAGTTLTMTVAPNFDIFALL